MSTATLAEAVVFARELADVAARIATRGTAAGVAGIRHKQDSTPVTDLDFTIERTLRAAVRDRYPDDGFLGEEEGLTNGGRRTWIVDPIDGTKNLIDGIQLWSTLIAAVDDGRPVVGIVDAPALGERYEAVAGAGATLNGSRITVSSARKLREGVVLHSGVEEWMRGTYWHGFCAVASHARRTRGISDAIGHMLVARGSADVLLEHDPCGPWDWAAVQVIVEEAGGRLTTLDGQAPTPGCNLLSTNGALHADVVRTLQAPAA